MISKAPYGKHPLDLLPQGLSPRRACPARRKRYRGARKGRRRVQEGNTVTVPENGHHPGLGSNCLPLSPVRSHAAPYPHRESHPVRSTFSRLPYLRSGRSLRRKRKREPFPCGSSSSYQTGQKGKKTTSASEQYELQKSSPAQNQTPTIQQTHQPPQVSEESWVDGEYVEQERCSPPHTSWSTLNPEGETERERPSQEEENTSSALLPPPVP